MQLVNTLDMPATFSLIEENELTYLDGGAETGIWHNWNFLNFLHGATLALGSASITAGTNFILAGLADGLTLGGALGAAGTAIAAFSGVQYALLGVCVATAAYTIYYEFMTIYRAVSSIYYRIFPKKDPAEQEEEEIATNGFGFRLAIA